MSSTLIEKELTCSICTELLFDPITLLNCLHHNCGACAKRWFSSQHNTAPTCPVCRRLVKGVGVSPIVVSILEDFLGRFPERGRTVQEIEEMREVWRPGEDVLPPPISRDQGLESRRSLRAVGPSTALQRVRPPRSNSDPPQPQQQLQLQLQVQSPPERPLASPRLLSRLLSPPPGEILIPLYYHPPRPRPRSPVPSTLLTRRPSLPGLNSSSSSFPPPSSVLQILQRGISPIIITCDHCSRRLDTSVHVECSECSLFHLCLRCFRAGHTCSSSSPTHHLTRQKLIASWPRCYLQVGVFCDVCDCWLDEDRNNSARADAMWWRCKICNDGAGWALCTRCVQRGWNCTHELEIWSNNRDSINGNDYSSSGLVRGPGPRPRHRPSSPSTPDSTLQLVAFGYAPWTWDAYTTACSLCKLAITPPNAQWLHCYGCPESHADLCTTCFYNLHRAFPSPSRGLHSFYLCPRGHSMSVLAQPRKRVLHQGVFAHAPKPRAPEWVPAGGARAVAVRGHWPEECEDDSNSVAAALEEGGARKWGKGQWLCFPARAEVLDVVTAFTEPLGEVEWCWGSYAGVGGLFPRGYVRFT